MLFGTFVPQIVKVWYHSLSCLFHRIESPSDLIQSPPDLGASRLERYVYETHPEKFTMPQQIEITFELDKFFTDVSRLFESKQNYFV